MNQAVNSQASPDVPAKPPRNPIERVAVWGGIGLMLLVVAIELRAKQGYAATLAALNAAASHEDHETSLAEVQQFMKFSPSVTGPEKHGLWDVYSCSWFSLCKHGQFQINLHVSRDKEPVLLEFTTPNAAEEPEPEMTANNSSPASSSGMGGPQMGMGGGGMGMGGGGMGMGGGGRRPNPVRLALDSDEDGSLSAAEITAAPTSLVQLDKDTDGTISAEELAPPAPAANPASAAGPPAASSSPAAPGSSGPGGGGSRFPNRLAGAIDHNSDGAISPEELAAAGTSLKSLDADSDGTITSEELRPPGGFGGGGAGGPGGGFGPPGGGDRAERSRRPVTESSTPATESPPADVPPAAEAAPTTTPAADASPVPPNGTP